MEKQSKRGGARPNCGRKPMYDEATETIAIRVPRSVKEHLQKADYDWRGMFIDMVREQMEAAR